MNTFARATLIFCFLPALGTANADEQALTGNTSPNHFSQLAHFLNLDERKKPHGIPQILANQFANPQIFPTQLSIKLMINSEKASWRTVYQENLRHFDSNFQILDLCPRGTATMPSSLTEASKQIEQIGETAQEQLLDSLSKRDWRWIRKNASKLEDLVMKQLSNQALTKKEVRTFKKFRAKFGKAKQKSLKCSLTTWHQLTDTNWLNKLRTLLEDHPKAQDEIIVRVETALGSIIFGGRADKQFYEKDILFIASLSGNDFYGLESMLNFNGVPQLIIDFGGDDRYQSSLSGGIASGVGRISTVIDFKGNDHYLSSSLSLGAGLLGYGLLVDLEGDDHYQSSIMAQGFGYYGDGQVIDFMGSDRYELAGLGQGVGFHMGLGLLFDRSGDDTYIAKGFISSNYGTPGIFEAWAQGVGAGFRPHSSGGIGLLIDRSGGDRYTAGSFSQGGGYFYGYGSLIDRGSGNDFYLGSRYHLAWAAHAGAGFFYDEDGNDIYLSRHSAGASAAWDRSITTFIDGGGDDQYALGGFSYGSSAHHSLAIFLDAEGKDQFKNKLETENHKGAPNLSVIIQKSFLEPASDKNIINDHCKQAKPELFLLTINSRSIEALFKENIYSIINRQCSYATQQD